LSEDARKRLQQCRDCTNQILKAAMAINSSVLVEMEIPTAYMETLPKVTVFLYFEIMSIGLVQLHPQQQACLAFVSFFVCNQSFLSI
jgi:hypothetical protein